MSASLLRNKMLQLNKLCIMALVNIDIVDLTMDAKLDLKLFFIKHGILDFKKDKLFLKPLFC